MLTPITRIQNLMRQAGGYQCPHFRIDKVNLQNKKSRCCANSQGDEFAPVCSLINGLCTGLAQCPRLDIKTKSELIKKWTEDLARGTHPNPLEYIKR